SNPIVITPDSAVGATQYNALKLINQTAATGGATVQHAGGILYQVSAWDTGASTARTNTLLLQGQAVSGNPTKVKLDLYTTINAGTQRRMFEFTSGDSSSTDGPTLEGFF